MHSTTCTEFLKSYLTRAVRVDSNFLSRIFSVNKKVQNLQYAVEPLFNFQFSCVSTFIPGLIGIETVLNIIDSRVDQQFAGLQRGVYQEPTLVIHKAFAARMTVSKAYRVELDVFIDKFKALSDTHADISFQTSYDEWKGRHFRLEKRRVRQVKECLPYFNNVQKDINANFDSEYKNFNSLKGEYVTKEQALLNKAEAIRSFDKELHDEICKILNGMNSHLRVIIVILKKLSEILKQYSKNRHNIAQFLVCQSIAANHVETKTGFLGKLIKVNCPTLQKAWLT